MLKQHQKIVFVVRDMIFLENLVSRVMNIIGVRYLKFDLIYFGSCDFELVFELFGPPSGLHFFGGSTLIFGRTKF